MLHLESMMTYKIVLSSQIFNYLFFSIIGMSFSTFNPWAAGGT